MASNPFRGEQPKSVPSGPPLLSVPCDITQGQRSEVIQSSPSLGMLGSLLPGLPGLCPRKAEEEGPGDLRGQSGHRTKLGNGRRTQKWGWVSGHLRARQSVFSAPSRREVPSASEAGLPGAGRLELH